MRHRIGVFVFSAMVVAATSVVGTAHAGVPALVNYQGVLTDGSGNPLPDAAYSIAFRIYNDSVAAGSPL